MTNFQFLVGSVVYVVYNRRILRRKIIEASIGRHDGEIIYKIDNCDLVVYAKDMYPTLDGAKNKLIADLQLEIKTITELCDAKGTF